MEAREIEASPEEYSVRVGLNSVAGDGIRDHCSKLLVDKHDQPLPQTKRRRTGVALAKPSQGLSRRRQGRLNKLVSMPLDILYDIFSFLTPADLLRLARLTKPLRTVLMSRNSISVWRSARLQHAEHPVPSPPRGLSEPGWAALLFWPFCGQCGHRKTATMQISFRKRVCPTCFKELSIRDEQVAEEYPEIYSDIVTLVPYVNGQCLHWPKIFWKPDIEELVGTLTSFAIGFMSEKPGAQEAWDAFKADRTAIVEGLRASHHEYLQWLKVVTTVRSIEATRLKNERFAEIKARMLDLGYESQDIESCRFQRLPQIRIAKKLTDRGWDRIRDAFEAEAIVIRDARLEQEEHQRRLCKRREAALIRAQREEADRRELERLNPWITRSGIVDLPLTEEQKQARQVRRDETRSCYAAFLRQVLPSQLFYFPAAYQGSDLLCFQEIIHHEAPTALPFTYHDWKRAAVGLPVSMMHWFKQRRTRFIKMLPPDFQSLQISDSVVRISTPAAAARRTDGKVGFAGALQLAVAVFTDGALAYIGRDFCNVWKMRTTDFLVTKDFLFSQRGFDAAANLVALVGRASTTTTAADMDRLDLRFVCDDCGGATESERRASKSQAEYAFGWRKCVDHYMLSNRIDHSTPSFSVLPPDITADVKSREPEDPSLMHQRWQCNHCSALPELEDRATVAEHILTVHNITAPADDEDLFYLPSPGTRRPLIAYQPVEPFDVALER